MTVSERLNQYGYGVLLLLLLLLLLMMLLLLLLLLLLCCVLMFLCFLYFRQAVCRTHAARFSQSLTGWLPSS